ncbi:aquaporin [Rhodococcus sp. JVH1]|uniref:aquaporin n=1 Tax=Rhodococcus sp. JVH1 TaxID=745408 RepID=UPI000271E5D0|nr:aquaporin [Rhodococcus sp. JVH1]EJI94376.1 major intrinsic protein [Rhodococcus sp. JVH1]
MIPPRQSTEGSTGEEAAAAPAPRPSIGHAVESIGTLFLVFAVRAAEGSGNPLPPLALGAVLMIMIYTWGHRSARHYNPAATMMALARHRIGLRDAAGYWLAQIGAGLLAVAAMTMTGHTPATASVVELVFIFALCCLVLEVATRTQPDNSLSGLAIGVTVVAGAFAVGAIPGGAFHPAVAVGAGAGTAAGFALITLNPPTHDSALSAHHRNGSRLRHRGPGQPELRTITDR